MIPTCQSEAVLKTTNPSPIKDGSEERNLTMDETFIQTNDQT
jgi:hypothetical protein